MQCNLGFCYGAADIVNALQLLPNGTLVTGCGFIGKGAIMLCDPSSGSTQELYQLEEAASIGLWKNELLFIGGNTFLTLFDLNNRKMIRTLQEDFVKAYAIISDQLFAFNSSNCVKLFNPITMKIVRVMEEHSSNIYGLIFSKDKNVLISGSADCTIKIWDPFKGKLLSTIHTEQPIYSLINLNSRIFATSSDDGIIQLWDLLTKQLVHTFNGPPLDEVCSLAFQNGVLSSGFTNGNILLWDCSNILSKYH